MGTGREIMSCFTSCPMDNLYRSSIFAECVTATFFSTLDLLCDESTLQLLSVARV